MSAIQQPWEVHQGKLQAWKEAGSWAKRDAMCGGENRARLERLPALWSTDNALMHLKDLKISLLSLVLAFV